MHVRMRYVTRRGNRKVGERWYWQRRGHPLTRLPDNLIERMAMVERLNNVADAVLRPRELEGGTIGWVIERYRNGDEYQALAPSTLIYYKRYLREIEALGPTLPFASFTRKATVDFIETYTKPHQRRQAATVLKNLFQLARYHGLVEKDEATGLRLGTAKARHRVWSDAEISAWLDAATAEGHPHMATAFLLLQFTAQRPSDVLKMAWPHYSGSAIRVRQQKTGVLLDVPVHPILRVHLDMLDRKGPSLTIVSYRGRPVRYGRFRERFSRIALQAGVDAQARDLRRTAMLRMAEAGATTPQIASVSGHSIEATQRILETYLPRNRTLAEIAITRLAEYQKGH